MGKTDNLEKKSKNNNRGRGGERGRGEGGGGGRVGGRGQIEKIYKNQSKMVKTAENSEKRQRESIGSIARRLTLWQK